MAPPYRTPLLELLLTEYSVLSGAGWNVLLGFAENGFRCMSAGLSARERARLKRLAKKRPAAAAGQQASGTGKRKKEESTDPATTREVHCFANTLLFSYDGG